MKISSVSRDFSWDKERTKGNVIQGRIEMKKEGYLITSIPYEPHFEVRVDGKQVTCEKVNTAFLGVKLEKGEHEITIIYHAAGSYGGKNNESVRVLPIFRDRQVEKSGKNAIIVILC